MSVGREVVQERCRMLTKFYGSQRKAAKALGIGCGHFNRLLHGVANASDAVLDRLCIERVTVYKSMPYLFGWEPTSAHQEGIASPERG